MHTTRSAPCPNLCHALFSTPAFLCAVRGSSQTTVTGYRRATATVPSVAAVRHDDDLVDGPVWASSDSIAGAMSPSPLCAGISATIRGRGASGNGVNVGMSRVSG